MQQHMPIKTWLKAICACLAVSAASVASAEDVQVQVAEAVMLASGSHAQKHYPLNKYQTLFAGASWAGVSYKTLLRFDVTKLPTDKGQIQRITLTLYDKTDESQKDDILLGVFAVTDANGSWSQDNTTWDHRDAKSATKWAGQSGLTEPGADYAEPALATAFELADTPEGKSEELVFDLTAIKDTLFEQWRKGDNAGLLLMRLDPVTKAETTVGGRSQIYTHRFTNDRTLRPTLTITYSEPN